MNIAVVLAGGIGSRVGAGIPKQFVKVLGKPIMIYTLEVFRADNLIDEIVFVCVETHINLAEEYCRHFRITKAKTIVKGGSDFLHSCINGINALEGRCAPDDIVVVTSADRPFISQKEIDDSVSVCMEHGSGIAARKCPVCMFMTGEDKTHSRNYQRDNLLMTATPWTFRYGLLKDSLDRFEAGEFPGCEPYPVAVFAEAGNEVYFSAASPRNIKITEKTDIALMEQILKERKGI